MTVGQTCYKGNLLILTFGFTFVIILIFNYYHYNQNTIPQKQPKIAKIHVYEQIIEKPKSTSTSEPKNCKPVQKLAFAKTHKTGGSTLQNIFMRYGYKNGLTFAIPPNSWMYSFNVFFNSKMVTNYTWNPQHTFDMMVFHSLWNGMEVDKVIPRPSPRFTLLRDPVDTFESGYVYMGLEMFYNMSINEYAKKILKDGFPPRYIDLLGMFLGAQIKPFI